MQGQVQLLASVIASHQDWLAHTMSDFAKSFTVIIGGALAAQLLSFPLTAGLNHLAVQICKHAPNRGLVSYDERSVFGGRKIACVPKKYI